MMCLVTSFFHELKAFLEKLFQVAFKLVAYSFLYILPFLTFSFILLFFIKEKTYPLARKNRPRFANASSYIFSFTIFFYFYFYKLRV
jgi:hypothetical protein